MSGVNHRIEQGCRRRDLSPAGYAARLRALGEVATLGYHGHFWLDVARLRDSESGPRTGRLNPSLEMRCNNFLEAPLRRQIADDLEWFERSGLDHHGAYAGGWWFTNRTVLSTLIDSGFRYDFTFTHSRWFRSEYSYMLLHSNHIPPGAPFVVHSGDRELLCLQMLLGCHQTPFVGDFRRNLAALIGPHRAIRGVVGAHDYDVDPANTLAALRALRDEDGATFFDLDALAADDHRPRPPRFDLARC